MITDPSLPANAGTTLTTYERPNYHSICWGAILAGTVAAIGIHLLLTALGVGAGLAAFSPLTDSDPIENFSIGAAIVWSVCALVALAFGGFIAGRFSGCPHRGFSHGIIVWSLTLIITLLLVSMGTGMVLGGALKVLGQSLGIGAQAAAAGATDVAKEGVKRGGDQLASFIDEAAQSVPTNAAPKAATRARREVGFAVTKLFAPGNDVPSPENRRATIKALVEVAQVSEVDATRMVDDWTTSYRNLVADLETIKTAADKKARELADRAARNLSSAATWSFFALLLGLVATAFGGRYGAECALRHSRLQCTTVAKV